MLQLENVFNLIQKFIPEGTEKSFEADGVKVSLSNKDGEFKINIVNEEEKKENDKIKVLIEDFKEKVDELDDDIFDDVTNEFSKAYCLKDFDTLLSLDSYTDADADRATKMIDIFNACVRKHLTSRINKLAAFYDKFYTLSR